MTDFLIGCTHFGHANIIKLANRPFDTIKDMDGALIDNWNRTVGPNDTVYHLGDFAWGGSNAQHYADQLSGRLVKIQGNHDSNNWGQDYLTLKWNKTKVVLFHYPIEEWDRWYGKSVHFHSHTHATKFQSAERRGNVGVDAIGFTPIRLSEAVERLLD